jgi:hypothetical protein
MRGVDTRAVNKQDDAEAHLSRVLWCVIREIIPLVHVGVGDSVHRMCCWIYRQRRIACGSDCEVRAPV